MKSKAVKEEESGLISIKKTLAIKVLYAVLQGLTLATLVFTLVMYFIRREGLETTSSQVFMCLLALLTFNVPIFLERKFKVYIPPYITIILYVLMFSHAILGEIYRAYDNLYLFDKILHTTSGVVIALVSFSLVSILNNLPTRKTKLSPFFVVLFAFCFTMTSEYLWEIFEYVADTIAGTNMQRWQDSIIGALPPSSTASGEFLHNSARGNGVNDTMGDMIVNVFGALGVCIYGFIGMKLKPNWFSGIVIMRYEDVVTHNLSILKEKNMIDNVDLKKSIEELDDTQKIAEGMTMSADIISEIAAVKNEVIEHVKAQSEQKNTEKIENTKKDEKTNKNNS